MQEFARRIAKVSKESKLALDEDTYVSTFKVELMDCVMQWCRGASFSDICKVSFFPFFTSSHLVLHTEHDSSLSSPTFSREVLFVSSGVWENYSDKWPPQQKSSETSS